MRKRRILSNQTTLPSSVRLRFTLTTVFPPTRVTISFQLPVRSNSHFDRTALSIEQPFRSNSPFDPTALSIQQPFRSNSHFVSTAISFQVPLHSNYTYSFQLFVPSNYSFLPTILSRNHPLLAKCCFPPNDRLVIDSNVPMFQSD